MNDSAECNVSQLVCDENGHTIVPTYDWTDFFAPHLNKVTGSKKYHHFRFTSSEPGVVYARVHSDTDEVRMDLNKSSPPWLPNKDELPPIVALSAERQWYLYENHSVLTVTRTSPDVLNPKNTRRTQVRDTSPPLVDVEPPIKRKRLCGTCRQEGHNSRSCPN